MRTQINSISSKEKEKCPQKTSVKANYAVTKNYVSGFDSAGARRENVWGRAAVKSSVLRSSLEKSGDVFDM